jgi:hypothetical protein
MQNAMYGLLRSALLFYLKLRKDLEEFGFTVNEYDPCIANKVIKGTQMTVVWHVDDLKVSHVNQKEIVKLLVYLGESTDRKSWQIMERLMIIWVLILISQANGW